MAKAKLISVKSTFTDWQQARLDKCNKCSLNENGYCIHIGCNKKVAVKNKIIHKGNKCPNNFWGKYNG